MSSYIFNEAQLRKLIELTAEALLENTEIEVNVHDHNVSISTAKSSLTFDDALQIAGQIDVAGLCHIMPLEKSIDYKNNF